MNLDKQAEILSKQAEILNKHAAILSRITKENEVYIALGGALVLNQLFEGVLKNQVKLRYLSQKKELPNNFSEQTLGFFIKTLKKSIPDTRKNQDIIRKLFDFNKMRIEIMHKIFEVDDWSPSTFKLFIKKRIKDRNIMNEISKMMHFSLECLESIKGIS